MTQYLGNALELPLESATYDSLEGNGTVAAGRTIVGELSTTRIGVWEAEPGLIGGVTTDEIFVVLEGRAEVTFEDTGETIAMGPGDIVRLRAGQRNTWRTIERLRKIAVHLPMEA